MIRYAFFGGLIAYLAGAMASVVTPRGSRLTRFLCCGFALAGGLLEIGACGFSIVTGADPHWEIRSAVPFLSYGFHLDALSAYFTLILSILAAAVSVYSFDYLRPMEERKTVGVL